jgi:hypothetical protein
VAAVSRSRLATTSVVTGSMVVALKVMAGRRSG